MLGWAFNAEPVQLWIPPAPMPQRLRDALQDSQVIKIAWYAVFERLVSRHALGIEIPIRQWKDPITLARNISLPGKLDEVCDILKIDKDQAKIKHGKQLIKLFCLPNGQAGRQTLWGASDGFNDPRDYPVEWEMFKNYCIRDVEIERTLWNKLVKLYPEELWEDYWMSEEMNETGIPFNRKRAEKALQLAERCKNEFKQRLNELTGLENANSRAQLLPWLQSRGYALGSIEKKYVDLQLKNPALQREAKEVLELRQQSAQNSYKKLERMLALASPDDRIRHQFTFMGAARTGRWSSGGGFQAQNLPRPVKEVKKMLKDDPARIFHLIDNEEYDTIKSEFKGSTLPFVGSILRNLFETTPDKEMVVCDLSSIEYVILGWMASCQAICDCVSARRDPYLDFAVKLNADKNFSYEELKKKYDAKDAVVDEIRQKAKPAVLGAGYALGGGDTFVNEHGDTVRGGLWGYALNVCGVDLPKEEAHRAVKIFREVNYEVVQLWLDMEMAFKHTLKTGEPITVGEVVWNKWDREWTSHTNNFTGCKIKFDRLRTENMGWMIRMHLPSGRCLHYLNAQVKPEIVQGKDGPWKRHTIYYEGIEHSSTTDDAGAVVRKNHKWSLAKTHGGKLVENADQAIARDVLVNGSRLAKGLGFQLWGLFHDEAATEVKKSFDAPSLEDLRWSLIQPPEWGPTLILDAAGYISKFYRKD